jgi:hypothetical protein
VITFFIAGIATIQVGFGIARLELNGSAEVCDRADKISLVTALFATLDEVGRAWRRLRRCGVTQQQRTGYQ